MNNDRRENILTSLQVVCIFVSAWVLFKLISLFHPTKSIFGLFGDAGLLLISIFFAVKIAFDAIRNLQERYVKNASIKRMIAMTVFEMSAAVLLCLATSYYAVRILGV